MANTKSNCGSEPPSPKKTICEFQKGVRDERAESTSRYEGSRVTIQSLELARGYKLCYRGKSEETFEFYRDFHNYELFDAHQSAIIIKANLATYVAADTALTTAIDEGAKLLNKLEKDLLEANNLACQMRNCLKSVMGSAEDSEALTAIAAITDEAKKLAEQSQKAAKALQLIAGVHKYVNLGSIQEIGNALEAAFKGLKSLLDQYVKKATDEVAKAQADLLKVVDSLNTEEFTFGGEKSKWRGLDATIRFICLEKCEPLKLDEICKRVSSPDDSNTYGGKHPKDQETDRD